ncbi:acyl-CoA dehydrogenase [Mariniphaga sediminis]|uniref:Acyl-CoA dehydrogenase n=1 Tax=Mariniphaga sediminis TaxID=1628158 RepID=A0A399CTV2_9BACT|nr:acyl-CoA dehydrogenase family protein [Mariniphaga sediminis]RIH62977.1 acyl-CoA dehydrogenase [Mariniphaga sediminis]
METKKYVKGGEFMVKDLDASEIFIPEEFDEEQKMIAETCRDFLDTEVMPNLDRIDIQEEGFVRGLLDKAGELGLLGISIPEELEGFGQSFVTSMLASEVMGSAYSFAVTYSCHTGIGSMPILYFGNDEQKQKYLPKLASGEWAGAYCLTEPGAGSDANSGKTRATLSEDGKHYILNGQKMWITNTGFADVFTVFAKIDNDRVLSAFIIERDFPGLKFNPEEKKMGIKGSSTRQIFFEDCKVPVENLLWGRGKGFRIALDILHMGRIKLGGNVIGAAKMAIDQSVNYANERKQFGQLISSFGAIKYKLAEQVIRTFTNESAVYRASRNVDEYIEMHADTLSKEEAIVKAFEEYAIEAAILKVYGSEALDYVVDEGVQIHGGMGYSSEMPIERGYRDSRINRIFEGTNEINRLVTIDTLNKRGAKKDYDLYLQGESIINGLESLNGCSCCEEGYYENKKAAVKNFKKVGLMLMKAVSEKFGRQMMSEQEILDNISNIIMKVYVAESALLRVQKKEGMGQDVALYKDILDVFIYDTAAYVRKEAKDAINSFTEGEQQKLFASGISHFTCVKPVNVKDARRRIADKLIEENKYCF